MCLITLFCRSEELRVEPGGDPAVRLPDGATVEQHARAGLPDAQTGERTAALAAALGLQVGKLCFDASFVIEQND